MLLALVNAWRRAMFLDARRDTYHLSSLGAGVVAGADILVTVRVRSEPDRQSNGNRGNTQEQQIER